MKRMFLALAALSLGLVSSLPSNALALKAGTLAPEIGLKDLAGRGVNIAGLKGKVVVVDFWASWCAPCREELPVLEALYKKEKARGLEIVGVNQDQSADNVKKFLSDNKLSFRVVHDKEGAVAERYEPSKMPSSYVIDRKGVVRYVHAGFKASDKATLEKEVAALLDEK